MRAKGIIGAFVLAFAAGSLVYSALRGEPTEMVDIAAPEGGVQPELVVCFFDTDVRCDTCIKLEGYAHEALLTQFPEEVASGRFVWRKLDLDAPENQHYADDFGLITKSVVLVAIEDGAPARWQNLDQVWDLVYDKEEYETYIGESIRVFLGEAP